MNVSVCVALRDTTPDQTRARVWDTIARLFRMHLPDLEVVVASDDGQDPFHKTAALNEAADRARGDILLFYDADTWVPAEQVRQVIAAIGDGFAWGRPWSVKAKLCAEDSVTLLALGPDWDGTVPQTMVTPRRLEMLTSFWKAPPLAIHRRAFEHIGGWDLRFRGWGGEDEAFAYAARCLIGAPHRVKGYAYHLWHPRFGRSGRDRWSADDPGGHPALVSAYLKAMHSQERMRALVAEHTMYGRE